MKTSFCLYPMPIVDAIDVAKQINLGFERTHIEPSRYCGFLFDHPSPATMLRMLFDGKYWPTKVNDLYLIYVERSPDVSAWIDSCGYEFQAVEIVAILFGSDEDQESFEEVIWPHRAKNEGVEIC
ncbi:hypothetical protein FNL56_09145 [Tardiphaga sp. vice304]|uniref:hypothetical protein n=1 Tax=Tardiphaga sp. vice304 TaxID=2592817 RepID=UPI00116450E3|nr:hypothetical protein [Tardiphaga sp. vice304]QDM26232.1 hypothetical protein FNL56_09145 [Tardiphaga sp. vice304]